MTARVASLNVSPGGVPKRPIPRARLGFDGLAGDGHRYRLHGGPRRALCLYALERILALRAEGHPVGIGWLGENVTTRGLDWDAVRPGVGLRIGPTLVVVTEYTVPCRTIAGAFADRKSGRVSARGHPGWARVYARVLVEGVVAAEDPIEMVKIPKQLPASDTA